MDLSGSNSTWEPRSSNGVDDAPVKLSASRPHFQRSLTYGGQLSPNPLDRELLSENRDEGYSSEVFKTRLARASSAEVPSIHTTAANSNSKPESILVRAKSSTASFLLPRSAHGTYTNLRTIRPVSGEDAAVVHSMYGSTVSLGTTDQRSFYDDFTTVDWVHDTINESSRRKYLQSLPGIRGKIVRASDGVQGWVLIVIVAFCFSLIAYFIDVFEAKFSDLKTGYCSTNPLNGLQSCCPGGDSITECGAWVTWSEIFKQNGGSDIIAVDFVAYMSLSLMFAYVAVTLTLMTRTVNPLHEEQETQSKRARLGSHSLITREKRIFYSGYGSGVPEVKTILSGFIIRKFLGTRTLVIKTIALIFSISSGLSIGKEGPYVHLAACVGNISCRLFPKFTQNDIKRRQILAAAAAAGVALAFGSPLGGVLFSLEEVAYHFLPQHLFRIFFCAMISALFLKFWDPYGTGKIVLFEVSYPQEWKIWELGAYIFLGICGGIYGALFCKFTIWWPKVFRTWKPIKTSPTLEVLLITTLTATVSFFNPYTKKSVTELLLDLASPCTKDSPSLELCPADVEAIPRLMFILVSALVVKAGLTSITFGVKVPSGIYVPSMVVGALFGRILALAIQYFSYSSFLISENYEPGNPVTAGTYAMAGAGAFLAGVTRMNVTLAVILFEITGSLGHVLPFSTAILFANWIGNAIEPHSIYELVIHNNNFPFLDNRRTKAFDNSLADLVTKISANEKIDLSESSYVGSTQLRNMVMNLQRKGDFDGCVPLVKGDLLVGAISTPELEYALDRLQRTCQKLGCTEQPICTISVKDSDINKFHKYFGGDDDGVEEERGVSFEVPRSKPGSDEYQEGTKSLLKPESDSLQAASDLTRYIDRAPITLDFHSPMSLVHMIFSKLGARIIFVVKDGKFVGVLHRKKYIDFCHNN